MLNILIVDDNPGDRRLLQDTIEETGFECKVAVAAGGDECFNIVRDFKPDLFILDVMMPKINGYELCYSLKYDFAFKKTPFLILTSRQYEIDPRIGELMGVSYQQKPCTVEALIPLFDKILKSKETSS